MRAREGYAVGPPAVSQPLQLVLPNDQAVNTADALSCRPCVPSFVRNRFLPSALRHSCLHERNKAPACPHWYLLCSYVCTGRVGRASLPVVSRCNGISTCFFQMFSVRFTS